MKTSARGNGSSDDVDAPRAVQVAAELLADPEAAPRARRLRAGVFVLLLLSGILGFAALGSAVPQFAVEPVGVMAVLFLLCSFFPWSRLRDQNREHANARQVVSRYAELRVIRRPFEESDSVDHMAGRIEELAPDREPLQQAVSSVVQRIRELQREIRGLDTIDPEATLSSPALADTREQLHGELDQRMEQLVAFYSEVVKGAQQADSAEVEQVLLALDADNEVRTLSARPHRSTSTNGEATSDAEPTVQEEHSTRVSRAVSARQRNQDLERR